MVKSLKALALGAVLLALPSHAKTTVAFLGIDPDTDPLFGRALTALIQQDLAADTGLATLPPRTVSEFLAKAPLRMPEAGPADIGMLKLNLQAEYYAFGKLEELNVSNKRVWWKPWSVQTQWSRALRLRVLDGATGETVFDGQVPALIPEQNFISGPDGKLSEKGALERDRQYRRMLPFLSAEAVKTLGKVLGERSAGNPG